MTRTHKALRWLGFWLAYGAILQWIVPLIRFADEVAEVSLLLGILTGGLLMNASIGLLWLMIPKDDPKPARPGPEPPAEPEPVRGRAPGLSECASPFGQTEARAKRTLDPPRPETASARECGAALPPRAPDASRARVG